MSDGRLRRVRLKFERDFTQIPNDWVRDKDLSLRARGLLALLMSHDDGFVVTHKSLAATNPEGITAIQAAVGELKSAGYLVVDKVRGRGGKIVAFEWVLTDPAQQKSRSQPELDYPYMADPYMADPYMDKPLLKEAHSEEHSLRLNKANPSTGAGIEEDALTGDHPQPPAERVETPAERYERLVRSACRAKPSRFSNRSHTWSEGDGYCSWCGQPRPSAVEVLGAST